MTSNILIIGTGSQAACNIAGLASELPHNIMVILTRSASRFITNDTLRNVGSVTKILDDCSPQVSRLPNHIWASEFADLIIVYPASAGFLGKMANGLALDLASTVILATDPTRTLVYPSMNQTMWSHPAVVQNVKVLNKAGFIIFASRSGQAPAVDEVAGEANRIVN
jgi:phosphopantothenoylcysteine decarboxylase / phosphopantothenate---cysteine ligase